MSERAINYGGVLVERQNGIRQHVQLAMDITNRGCFDKFLNKLVAINESLVGKVDIVDYKNNTVLSKTRRTKRKTTNPYLNNVPMYEQTMNLVTLVLRSQH